MTRNTYGRHRDSIADIEQLLHEIFTENPNCNYTHEGVPTIPGTNLVEVVQAFSDRERTELMNAEELDMLKSLVASNPDLEVTPHMLVQFIAEKTKTSPPRSPAEEEDDSDAMDGFNGGRLSRSSSSDSIGTRRGTGSRPPSRGPPQTPTSSVFDSSKRQRSTPLGSGPPSSWSKRPPPNRRKSDAGSRSDSEYSASPSAYQSRTRSRTRTRTPSNPTSPESSMILEPASPIMSPPLRPHSRSQSQPQNKLDYSSPEEEDTIFHGSISSLPMPRAHSSDSDEEVDEADSALGLVMDRSIASSIASIEPSERLEVLQRANADLGRRVMEAEKTLQRRLAEHDSEIEEMQSRLEEMRSELSATKREEKELRSKERQNQNQISALELEISKMTKALDGARANYQSLQKQYQEQCTASEKYRDDLRARDDTIRTLREGASLFELEQNKWGREQAVYEDRLLALEDELVKAQEAQRELDEQKQENLMLKETIDRMRYDMDEMRNSVASGMSNTGSTGSGHSSAANTVSKSLGAELLGKMQGDWGMEEQDEQDEDGMEEIDQVPSGEETEGEDVIQTIITRKKRKVASRANAVSPSQRPSLETRAYEELKEYSDSGTQYDPTPFFVNSFAQTAPEPKIPTRTATIQTDQVVVKTLAQIEKEKPIPKVTVEMETQTEQVDEEEEEEEDSTGVDTMASSSSTILPPTPKAKIALLEPTPLDQPPAYTTEEEEWRRVGEVLRKYHPGLDLHSLQTLLTSGHSASSLDELLGMPGAIRGVEGEGIPEELIHEWKSLKDELGVECLVIDKILASSAARSATASSSSSSDKGTKRRSGRFYNIYNTYVYGSGKGSSSVVSQAAMFLGVSAFFLLALAPYLAPPAAYSVPGGPSYYDRQAWGAFNGLGPAGEGFWGDGGFGVDNDPTSAVWSFLGRVGRGAVRTVQGWPT